MKMLTSIITVIGTTILLTACGPRTMSSSDIRREAQEKSVKEGIAQVGMPAIKNFREAKLKKYIDELRDQEGLVTYTYLENVTPGVVRGHTALGGKLTFLCNSVGYGIPYATQFTAPQSMQRYYLPRGAGENESASYGVTLLPQAEPNGLFSPDSAEGTWVICTDPQSNEAKPVYIEPRIITVPFKFPVD